MATFGRSKDILSQWKGKQVRVLMMSGEAPGTWGPSVTGELMELYNDAILLKVSNYLNMQSTEVEVLFFAQAIRGIHLLPRQLGAGVTRDAPPRRTSAQQEAQPERDATAGWGRAPGTN